MGLKETFIKKFKAGEKKFNDDYEGIDLSKMEFKDVSFQEAILAEANFSGSKFTDVDLSMVLAVDGNWEGVECVNVDMYSLRLSRANLKRAKFINCNIDDVGFRKANLENCIFQGCTFKSPDFSNANLKGATFSNESILGDILLFDDSNISEANFKNCQFENPNFADVIAIKANFENITTKSILFAEADLTKATFKGSILKELWLEDCTLKGTVFSGATFIDADLTRQSLEGVDLKGVKYNKGCLFPDDFDPLAEGMILIADIKSSKEKVKSITFGKTKAEKNTNSLLHACKIPTPEEASYERWPLMFNGGIYDGVYFTLDQQPEKATHDAKIAKEAKGLSKKLGEILEGAYESSAEDVPYFPFVILPQAGDKTWKKKDVFELLGLSDHFDHDDVWWDEEDINKVENAFADEEDFDKEDLKEYKKEGFYKQHRKATEWMKKNLKYPVCYHLYTDSAIYRKHPIFWMGKTPGGAYVGMFSIEAEP